MSITIYPGSQQNWSCAGAPQSTIVLGQGGTLLAGDILIDSTINNQYIVTTVGSFDSNTQTYSGCSFNQFIFNSNLLSSIGTAGWKINTARNFSQRSSPAFNTSYTPNSTNDILAIMSISITSTILTPGTVNMQVDTGSGFVTIASPSLSGLAATTTKSITIPIPASASYKLVQASGTSSIVSIYELSL